MSETNSQKAFTLVELMVAIVIIGVLSAVAVAGYGMYVKKARAAEAYTGLDNMSKGQITHFVENKSFDSYISGMSVTVMNDVYSSKGHYLIQHHPLNATMTPPFPIGTPARWFFQAVAYKADGNGDMLATTTPNGWLYSSGVNLSMWGRDGWCINKTGTSLMPPDRAHYTQVVVRAFTDFYLETPNNECSGIDRRIFTNENGKVATGPYMEYAVGK